MNKVRVNECTSLLDTECSRSSTTVKVRANESTSLLDTECSRSSTTVKDELRREMRRRFLASTADFRRQSSRGICASLLRDGRINDAKYIMAFAPMEDEPDIMPLIDRLRTMGKHILLPVVTGGEDMILREYNGAGEMTTGRFGIAVPEGQPFTRYGEIDVVLVPGQAFSKSGERLGRGRGFYDRFLPRVARAYKCGVCFPYALLDTVPCDEKDIKTDYVQS